jgi:nicotinate dehydrogenase subunit A
MATYNLLVNGQSHTVESWDPAQPLLYVLRNALGLHGPKFGCGAGQCGSCTVVIDDEATRACLVPVSSAVGKRITTIEGIGSPENPHPVQIAFIAEQAAQCGYCTNGMVMGAFALLAKNAHPSADEVKDALAGNLCRCGSHDRVLRAVRLAAASAKAGA